MPFIIRLIVDLAGNPTAFEATSFALPDSSLWPSRARLAPSLDRPRPIVTRKTTTCIAPHPSLIPRMFSCCARDEHWNSMCKLDTAPFRRTPTVSSSAPKQCDFSCMQKQVQDPASLLYVHLARDILAETMKMYPSDSVWVTGHSLGGSLAALASLSITHRAPHTLVPAITFEAPGTRSMAERAGVFPARHQVPEGMHQDAWTGILDAALSGTHHDSNTHPRAPPQPSRSTTLATPAIPCLLAGATGLPARAALLDTLWKHGATLAGPACTPRTAWL